MPDALKNSYTNPTRREFYQSATRKQLILSSASAPVSRFAAETRTEVTQRSHHKSLLQAQRCQLLNKLVLFKYEIASI